MEYEYRSFIVRFADGESGPEVRVIDSPEGSGAMGPFENPFTTQDLARFASLFEAAAVEPPRAARGRHLVPDGLPIAIQAELEDAGRRLYRALFQDQVEKLWHINLGWLSGRPTAGLRLEIRVDSASEKLRDLHRLPWELLCQPGIGGGFLCQRRRTQVVRHLELPRSREMPPPPSPLEILLVASSPVGVGPLDLAREVGHLETALAARPDVRLRRLELATLDGLVAAFEAEPVHVLHFMGHATFESGSGQGALILEDLERKAASIAGARLACQLGDFVPPLRLVFLNACRTGAAAAGAPYAGVATALMASGVPAVIAMQYPVSDLAAIAFSAEVYRRLAEGEPVDRAVAAGRMAIERCRPAGSIEWATPALFLRVPDGRVFAAPELLAEAEPASPPGSDGGRWRRWGPFAAALAGVALTGVLGWRGVTGVPGTADDGNAGVDPAPAEELREAAPTAAGLLHTGSRRASRAEEGEGGPAGENRPEKRSERARPEGGAVPGVLELVAGRPVFLPEISAHVTAELITFRGKELVRVTLSPSGGPSQARLGVPGNTLELGTGEEPLYVELVAADRDAGTIRLLVRR